MTNYVDLNNLDETIVNDYFKCTAPNGDSILIDKLKTPIGYEKQLEYLLKVATTNYTKGHFNLQAGILEDDSVIKFININNESLNSVLYEPLTKLGIYSNIVIGFDARKKILYLEPRLLNKINSMSDNIRKSLIMYMIILDTFIHYIDDFKNIEYDEISFNVLSQTFNSENTDICKAYTNLVKSCYYDFNSNNLNIELKDISSIRNFAELKLDSLDVAYNYSNFGINYDYQFIGVISTDENGEEKNGILFYNEDSKNIFILIENKIITNKQLSIFDLDNDTVFAPLKARLGNKSLYITYTEKFKDLNILDESEFYNVCKNKEFLSYLEENFKGYIDNITKLLKDLPFLKSEGVIIDNSNIIEQYKDDEYAQKLYTQKFDYFDNFDLKDLTKCIKGFQKGEIYSMLLIGESGTGKSTAAKVLSYRAGLPYISINLSANTEETDLFGTMIPNPNKAKPEDPEFMWKDGLITRAIKNGYVVILEEINFARPSILGKLNSLLDETKQVELPNGELIKAHPNFRLIATCNIAYEGTQRFNKALVNRFEIVKKFDDLNDQDIIDVIKKRIGYTDVDKINKVIQVYRSIKKFSENNNLDLVVSIRQLMTLFKQAKYYKNTRDAILNTLVHNAFIEEPEYEETFIEEILNAIDLGFKL